ncbi:MAG: hypothetical protein PHI87_06725 [Candidatus Methanomethylophilus sp.]|nr:hypothetical protein [Methanomethylophilus sp.]
MLELNEWTKNHGLLVVIAVIAIIAVLIASVTVAYLSTQNVCNTSETLSFDLVSDSLEIEIGDTVNIIAQTDLSLEWSLSNPLMGSLRKISENEVAFTASQKNGSVTIYAIAPNTNLMNEVEIQIFTHPEIGLEILSSALLEKGQNYRFAITYTEDSVSIDEIVLKDDLGNIVEGLDVSRNLINIEKVGTYSLEVFGTTYQDKEITDIVFFSVLPKIEAISTKPTSINLVSMAPMDILAIETFLKETHGLNVSLKTISQSGASVKVSAGYVALLFVRDNAEERVWVRNKVSLGDFYPLSDQNGFKQIRVVDDNGSYWIVAVDYSEYTSQITCVVAFPATPTFFIGGQITGGSIDYDSSSSGGGSTPPVVVPSGPSPDISP